MDHTIVDSNDTFYLDVAYGEQVFTSILILIIAIIGIIGNSMIILAVALSQKLHTSTNVFVANLGVTDFLASLFLIPYAIGTLGKNGWPLPNAYWLCQLTGYVVYACIGTSMYTLALIAADRLILITKPFLYRKIFTPRTLGVSVTVSWLVVWLPLFILVMIGVGEFGYDPMDLACAAVDKPESEFSFSLTITLIGFPIPLFVIIISYLIIYVHLKKHFERQKQRVVLSAHFANYKVRSDSAATSTDNTDTTDVSEEEELATVQINEEEPPKKVSPSRNRRQAITRQQIAITKNLFMSVCAFLLCFLPYFTLIFLPTPEYILFYTRVITLSNSAINFVIYSRKHPDFKLVMGCIIKCSYVDIPRPSRLLKFLLSCQAHQQTSTC